MYVRESFDDTRLRRGSYLDLYTILPLDEVFVHGGRVKAWTGRREDEIPSARGAGLTRRLLIGRIDAALKPVGRQVVRDQFLIRIERHVEVG